MAASVPPNPVHDRPIQRFGRFEVDPRSRELRRKGHRIRMQDQPLEVLLLLLERKGEVVTREELKQRLWPADTFVESDDGLNGAIRKLREALGDSAENPRYIETIPRRGYRFIGAVQEEECKAESDPAQPPVTDATSSEVLMSPPTEVGGNGRRWQLAVVAIIAAVMALPAWIAYRTHRDSNGSPAPITSLAVLPFANLSADPSQEYFTDAMTDEMTSDLAKIGALRVISRTSAMHFKRTSEKVPQIARELNVDGVIEGSVLRTGNRVRITVQLIDARVDVHRWSESYERDLKDVMGLQSELAQTIASQIRAVITPAEQERLHPESVNPAAYEAYMRGRFFVDRWTPEDSAAALHLFERSAELDQKFALAYVGIAECYVFGVAGVDGEEAGKRGVAAATRALELNPQMGEAHAMLGMLRLNREWDFKGAEAEIKMGIALSPNYAPAHHWYSHLLMYLGRYDESFVESKKLLELDPLSLTPVGHLAHQYLASRQWDKAIAEYEKSLAIDPTQIDEHGELGEAYVGKRLYQKAIDELNQSVEMSRSGTDHPLYLGRLGYARARAGNIAGAKKILSELPSDSLNEQAYIYAGLGDREKSINLLNEALRRHTFYLDAGYVVELDPLRSEPGFNEILHRVGLR